MSIQKSSREASVSEIAAEMDRRGAVIEKLEAERNLYKGKDASKTALLRKVRTGLGAVVIGIEDEGDRVYFGSSNDADLLKEFVEEAEDWLIDSEVKHMRMTKDPYAEIREQRSRAEKAEAALEANRQTMRTLREGLDGLPVILEEIRVKWDEGMRAGKLLIALLDPSLKYRADITAIHAAVSALVPPTRADAHYSYPKPGDRGGGRSENNEGDTLEGIVVGDDGRQGAAK